MEYVSADPVEAPVVLFDAKKGSGLKAEKTERGVCVRDGVPAPPLARAGAAVPELEGRARGVARRRVSQGAREVRRGCTRRRSPTTSRCSGSTRPSAPLVWAEIDGGKEDLVYELDRVDHPSEALLAPAPERVAGAGAAQVPLAGRAVAPAHRPRRARPGAAAVPADGRGPRPHGVGGQRRHAWRSWRRSCRSARRSPRCASISTTSWYAQAGATLGTRTERVRSGDRRRGAARSPSTTATTRSSSSSPSRRPPDRPVSLRFEIDGDFLVRPGGDNYWELGVSLVVSRSRTSASRTTRSTRSSACRSPSCPSRPGRRCGASRRATTTSSRRGSTGPMQCAVVLAGKYETHEEVRDGVTIRVATYALENDARDEAAHQRRGRGHRLLQELPRALPVRRVRHHRDQRRRLRPGAARRHVHHDARPSIPLIGEMNQLSRAGHRARRSRTRSRTSTGASPCGSRRYSEQWLAESFAEYSAALFLKAAAQRGRLQVARGPVEAHGGGFADDAAPIPMASRVYVADDAVRRGEIRRGLLYGKGPLLLAALNRRARRRGLPLLSQGVPGGACLEVRVHEERRRAAREADEEGLHAVLRPVLLGHGNAEGVAAGAALASGRRGGACPRPPQPDCD